jgi:hypothetical protein
MKAWTMYRPNASGMSRDPILSYLVQAESGIWEHDLKWTKEGPVGETGYFFLWVGSDTKVAWAARGRYGAVLRWGVPENLRKSLDKHGWRLNCPLGVMRFSNKPGNKWVRLPR